jgi:hypothetical protein
MTPGAPSHTIHTDGNVVCCTVEVPSYTLMCVVSQCNIISKHMTSTMLTLKSRMTKFWQTLTMNLRGYKSSVQPMQSDHRYDTDSFLIEVDNHA